MVMGLKDSGDTIMSGCYGDGQKNIRDTVSGCHSDEVRE